MKVGVVGSSGFVGGAVSQALRARGIDVTPVRAPRIAPVGPDRAGSVVQGCTGLVDELAELFADHRCVVNAAGDSRAGSSDEEALTAANGVLPAVLAQAALRAGVHRFVHVSSAAVQGRMPVLDETRRTEVFSPYSRSKALGEELLQRLGSDAVVVYRPPGVHGPQRVTTRSLVRVASSPFSSAAHPGTAPSPQAHIDNVGAAVAFLTLVDEHPPPVVIHPWEGLTTASLLQILGGREPLLLPAFVARSVTSQLRMMGAVLPSFSASARRLEMMWLGQGQARSWLEEQGWSAPAGLARWREMGAHIRLDQRHTTTKGIE